MQTPVPKTDKDAGLKDVLVDGPIGITVGVGTGGLAEVAANVSLFGASPLLAPLVTLGWSATWVACLAPLAGAVNSPVHDASSNENHLSAPVRDAIASGQIVLVVDAQRAQEVATAREVIQASVSDHRDVRIV